MKKGFFSVYVLVFGSIFILILGAIFNFILEEIKTTNKKLSWHQSLEIAESGVFYNLWCKNNGIECPTEREFKDIMGNLVGKSVIQVSSNFNCGSEISSQILSTGFTFQYPKIQRKIKIFFGKESVGKFSYLLNSDVWIGSDHIVFGPYHSNGGIRFDGQNLSTVSSGKEKWVCTSSFGCGPQGVGYGLGLCPPECQIINKECICPGVFSTTQVSKRDLFLYPSLSFDFEGITLDLSQLKRISQNSGIYLPPSNQINSKGKGWHLIFKEDGTVEARIITELSCTLGYSLEEDYKLDCFTISKEVFYQNFTISQNCSAIFVEDNLWPEGKIRGKVVLASANLINPTINTDTILQGNLDYTTLEGTDGLTLISQRNILIGPDSPNYMILRGIFIAQKGRFGRNHYQQNIKESLKIHGSVISNGRVSTQWVNQGGHIISGYKRRESFIDRNLIYNPPPFTPSLSLEFQPVLWEEL